MLQNGFDLINIYVEKNEENLKVAGIYKLTSKINNKIYIGKSINLYNRLRQHCNCSKRLVKGNSYIENVLKKHGWDSFTVEILETIEGFDKSQHNNILLERESHYIDLFDSTNIDIGYNLCRFSTDRTGFKCSDETKLKMSLASRGKPKSSEAVEKMRKSKIGKPRKPHSKETIEKINQTKALNKALGKPRKPFSEETRKKMSLAQRGKKMSEEAKLKISIGNKGKPKSKEHVEKCRIANTGRKLSDEHKDNIRQGNLGKKMSDEAIEKIRTANIGRKMTKEARENMRKARLRFLENQKND